MHSEERFRPAKNGVAFAVKTYMDVFTRSADALEDRILRAAELVRESPDAEVRAFGEEIVRLHAVNRQKLRQIAGERAGGGDGSSMLRFADHHEALTALHDALSELVRLCRQQVRSSCPADVRTYISCTLPSVELHARAVVAVLTRGATAAAGSSSTTATTSL